MQGRLLLISRQRQRARVPEPPRGSGACVRRQKRPGPGRFTPAPAKLSRKRPALRGPRMTSYLLLPILNILVPQSGQTPWVAGLPFFIVTAFSSFMVFLARHLTQ